MHVIVVPHYFVFGSQVNQLTSTRDFSVKFPGIMARHLRRLCRDRIAQINWSFGVNSVTPASLVMVASNTTFRFRTSKDVNHGEARCTLIRDYHRDRGFRDKAQFVNVLSRRVLPLHVCTFFNNDIRNKSLEDHGSNTNFQVSRRDYRQL